jgi:hypothetical protein
MTLEEAASTLIGLRPALPARIGSAWPDMEHDVLALLDRLEAARSDAERQEPIDDLLATLEPFPELASELGPIIVQRRLDRQVRRGTRGGGPPSLANGDTRRGRGERGLSESPGVLERTPHLDIDAAEPIAVGARFKATVWADTEDLRPEEQGDTLMLPDVAELLLRVTLTTSKHFALRGSASAELRVRAAEDRSTTATFELECVDAAPDAAGIAASFAHNWRPVGSVWREVAVAGVEQPSDAASEPSPAPAMSVDPVARHPDLTVQVLRSPDGNERHYHLIVSSPHVAELRDGVTFDWDLPSATREFVAGYMEGFTTSDRGGRKAALIGAGKELFSATPQQFQDAFWALADSDERFETISVVTAEPFIPWELMVPNDDTRTLPALGAAYSVGRWVHPQSVLPEQEMPLVDSYVIAPRYRAPRTLEFSSAEAEYVLSLFDGGDRISPASILSIDATLHERGATLLHLICHGIDLPAGQVLELDRDEKLREVQLSGMEGVVRALRQMKPFVFINACEVGRATPSLLGTGGFAARFTRLGARCVIAPIWSVKDDVAAEVSRKFYDAAQADPHKPFATILRDIRKLAYEGQDPEDSYAAYSFYGDPLAARARS